MDFGLKGRTVLITGGSKGIGLACAEAFAAQGAQLYLAAREREALEDRAAVLRARHGIAVRVHAADLRQPQARAQLAELCADADVLVNNAGDIPIGSVETLDDEAWRHAWELKVFGYIDLTRRALAHMKLRGSGVVVNVIGMSALNPSYEYTCGATANAALHAFTRCVGRGSREFGVRVVGVLPPATRTERLDRTLRALALSHYGDESRSDQVVKDGIRPPAIEPQQVADAVVYLASSRASQLSGVVHALGA